MRKHFVPLLMACLFCLSAVATAQAQPLESWLDPTLGDMKTTLAYNFIYSPDRQVEGQEVDMGYQQHTGMFNTPLWQNSNNELAMHGRAAYMGVNTDAILPNSGQAFPKDLYDVRLGGTYRYKMKKNWVLGGELTIGSPSDKPFNSYDDTSINATATLMTVQEKKHFWLFLLNYSNTRDFLADIPILGAAYAYMPDKDFQLLLGLPLASVRWRPIKKLNLYGLYVYPRTIVTKVGYNILGPAELYGGFEWTYMRWFLHERTDKKDRLFFFQKQLKLGIKSPLYKGLSADLACGYVFDRLWFQGDDYDDRNQDRVDLENGVQVTLNLVWRF